MVFLAKNTAFMEQMVKLNPWLARADNIIWRGFKIVWLKLSGWRPPSHAFGSFSWVSDGLIPVLDLCLPGRIQQPNPGEGPRKLFLIKFDDLVWPTGYGELFLLQQIESETGALLLPTPIGRPGFNYRTFARYIAAVNSLVYDNFRAEFKLCPKGAAEVVMTPESMEWMIMKYLHQISEKSGGKFPAQKIKPGMVKTVLALLKTNCARSRVGERDGVLSFLEKRIVRQQGASLTTAEIFDYYQVCCQWAKHSAMPQREFLRFLTMAMRRTFGVSKSHCVKRKEGEGTKARNGFFGVGWNYETAQTSKDAPDGKDGKDVRVVT
jgi:hypothetical protein